MPSSAEACALRRQSRINPPPSDESAVFAMPLAERHGRTALVVGTFDTKGRELKFIRDALRGLGIRTRTVDLSTSGKPSSADVTPQEVASAHPRGASAVFTGDRGKSVEAMALAFERWIVRQRDIGGVISAGGSGNTSLATAGMRRVRGRRAEDHDLDGRFRRGRPLCRRQRHPDDAFGRRRAGPELDHRADPPERRARARRHDRAAADRGGALGAAPRPPSRRSASPCSGSPRPASRRSPPSSRRTTTASSSTRPASAGDRWRASPIPACWPAAIDVTTTEVADLLVGGVFPATADRFGAFIRHPIPYVGSCGALDMVNFGPRDTVPEKFRGAQFRRPQSERHADAHDPRRERRRRRLDRRAAQPHAGSGALPLAGPAAFPPSTRRGSRSMIRRPTMRCSRRSRRRSARAGSARSSASRPRSTSRPSWRRWSRRSGASRAPVRKTA